MTQPLVEMRLSLPKGETLATGDWLEADLCIFGVMALGRSDLSLGVETESGELIYESLLSRMGVSLDGSGYSAIRRYQLRFAVPLAPGRYRLRIGHHTDSASREHEPVWAEAGFRVRAPEAERKFHGPVDLAPRILAILPEAEAEAAFEQSRQRWSELVPSRLELGQRDNPFLVSGFFMPEQGPQGWFRWTGREARFQLRLAGSRLQVRTVSCRPTAASEPVGVELFAGAESLGRFSLRSGVKTLAFNCPPRLVGQVVSFRLICDDDWRPAEHITGSTDPRRLGIAISEVEAGP